MNALPMNMPRVGVGVPSPDMLHADFSMALAAMCFDPGYPILLINAKGSLITVGRNNCVQLAQKDQCTHLLFLDSDMIFPNTTLKRLMAHGKDIVGATYHRRTPPFDLHGITPDPKNPKPDLSKDGLEEMHFMPTGCLLIRMEVFSKLAKPYFRELSDEKTGKIMGEDYAFSLFSRMAGYQLWLDRELSREIGHIGQQVWFPPQGKRPENLQMHTLNVVNQTLETVAPPIATPPQKVAA